MPRTLNRRLHRRLHPSNGEGRCNLVSFLSSFPLLPFFFLFFSAFRGNIRPLPRSHTRHNSSVVGYFRPILASFRRGNCCSGSQRVAISHEESPPFLAVNSFQLLTNIPWRDILIPLLFRDESWPIVLLEYIFFFFLRREIFRFVRFFFFLRL